MNLRQIKSLAIIKLKGNWGNYIAIYLSIAAMLLFWVLNNVIIYIIWNHYGYADVYSKNFFNYPIFSTLLIVQNTAIFCLVAMIRFMAKRQFIDIRHGRNFVDTRNAMYQHPISLFKISVIPKLIIILILCLHAIPLVFGIMAIHKQIIYSDTHAIALDFLFIFMATILLIVFSTIGFVFSYISLRFLPYIFIFNPKTPYLKAIRLSYLLAKGNKLKIIIFDLSFLKFLPLMLLIYPVFAISPYYLMSNILLIEDIMGEKYCNDTLYDTFEIPKEETESKSEEDYLEIPYKNVPDL